MRKLRTKYNGILTFIDYKKLRYKLLYAFLLLILIFVVVIVVFPPLWVLISSFKEPKELFSTNFTLFPKEFHLSKLWVMWKKLSIGRYYWNSILVAIGSILCAIVFNGLIAYGVSILRPKGHKMITFMIMITMMIPAVTNLKTLITNIYALGLAQSYFPIWLSYGANAFYFILFKVYFDRMPKELIEAAQLDGCNRLQIFYKIVIPLSFPIIGVVSIFVLNASWSDFLLPYLVLQDQDTMYTLMVRIYDINKNPPSGITQDQILMLIGLSIIPVLILFFIFQKKITESAPGVGIR